MFNALFNWRTALGLVAIAIVTGTIFYSNYLARKIAHDEREKVDVWVQSLKTRAITNDPSALDLTNTITSHNTDIPIIETDEQGNPSGEGLNLDTVEMKKDTGYLRRKVNQFRQLHEPLVVEISSNPPVINKYYYGDSKLLNEVSYYPLVQLFIVALFIIITLATISARNKSTQNQVWAGMAKETAHQLGTPISSLEGWLELLREEPANAKIATEMAKDVERLRLVSDRFGKIGSKPRLEPDSLNARILDMVDYIRRRSPESVQFITRLPESKQVMVPVSGPLFDWVIENLLKNALDALEGKGIITITLSEEARGTLIDVSDTGKGIPSKLLGKVFKPGFTTKKRGWGLGLSLSKRIIEQYHQGQLLIKQSEPGKGTTFRIMLPR
jgi:signal transduction histidine kinase